MKKRKYLTHIEVEQMIDAVPQGLNSARDRCMLLMCFIHGLRVSELRGLRLEDIDLNTNRLHVARLKNGFSVQHPIQIRERLAIKQWLSQRPRYLEADSPWLFLSRHGGQISRQQLYRLMKNYGQLAGISVQVHPHMLRHSCGFALADKGVDTRLIQDYLGHRNIQNTVIYTASNVERFRVIHI
ncbi:tyrosine-type DNA invertase [Serratia rhizosphaerae]|uniref:tyrosine-type DNA invertase n=1 Tax=unclassified Serratia (in: enterobacteria) TaxID=2647522 RepID=UPI000CF6075B|nr:MULTISPECIES: tyrosine-type DNA invertase [unclassified Serratia (in: enterobacteria)]MBU3894512.1 tyrosine-type recombinase/integrase [Serratia rubidaea]AVJ19039.1 integrase [Serratia sp. MYb239]MCA4825119.1 tyrosine-type recombinase/integrase [Serratia rubidaea]MCA4825742.1 tyrosine-type recombinase/integrase [Serratia rubidaea]QNK33450.1 tyrosine-type recombinase/integrase [Serratia sp. JUb9]